MQISHSIRSEARAGAERACALRAVEGLMHLAPACSFWLLLGVAFYEWPKMVEANAMGLIYAKPLLYLAAAAMGFAVNSLAYIVIQLASSLTLKVRCGAFAPCVRLPHNLSSQTRRPFPEV